jgi:hypothetical protein
MGSSSWKTALTRKKVALPIRKHLLATLSDPCRRTLDYGCGKGFDADRLGMFKYDPHFFPEAPCGPFWNVYCGYVLNVVSVKEGQQIVDDIHDLLGKRGRAFIVVRRDVKKAGLTSKGTYQRNVILKGASTMYRCSKYHVYSFFKGEDVEVA